MDHFKDFKGFGNHGTYLSHSKEDPRTVALNLLERHRGQSVSVEYHSVTSKEYILPEGGEQWHKMRVFGYGTSIKVKVFDYVDESFSVPKKGSLDGYLFGFNSDNILIKVNGATYEVQKINIGEQSVSEIRKL